MLEEAYTLSKEVEVMLKFEPVFRVTGKIPQISKAIKPAVKFELSIPNATLLGSAISTFPGVREAVARADAYEKARAVERAFTRGNRLQTAVTDLSEQNQIMEDGYGRIAQIIHRFKVKVLKEALKCLTKPPSSREYQELKTFVTKVITLYFQHHPRKAAGQLEALRRKK